MKKHLTTRVRLVPCPNCNKQLDAGTAVNHYGKPTPGDITVCIGCAAFLEWDGKMGLKPANLKKVTLRDYLRLLEMRNVILGLPYR